MKITDDVIQGVVKELINKELLKQRGSIAKAVQDGLKAYLTPARIRKIVEKQIKYMMDDGIESYMPVKQATEFHNITTNTIMKFMKEKMR